MQPTVLDSAQLDALIDKLKESGDREYDLIIEHLETANADLIGAMPQEGFFNLRLAQETLASLPRKPLTDEVKRTIESVFAALHSSPRLAPSKGGVKSFFQTAGASFGIFYPAKHVVAVYPSVQDAEVGHQVLSAAGFRMWETIVVPGEEAEKFLEELRGHPSLGTDLMRELKARSEVGLIDQYDRLARSGAAFLVVYSPAEAETDRIADLLKPLHPMTMHWFMPGEVRRLI